jgi:protein-S-isoprenylcysteine O-methyltransferase Ste14
MNPYSLLADIVLIVHFIFVMGVIIPVPLIIAGKLCGWRWVRNKWFRGIHLAMIVIVVGQAIFNMICPLTLWESQLRQQAGAEGYEGSFVAYWVSQILFYDFAPWVFEVAYIVFCLIIIALFIWVPPEWKKKQEGNK